MNNPREPLLQKMSSLAQEGKDCQQCVGTCCTYVLNSMQITPSETFDILLFLKKAGRLDLSLRERLENCVQHFGLDRPLPGNAKRSFLRRTYTCPFYTPGYKGCELPREVRPYGCLAFNPTSKGAQGPSQCRSDQKLLESVSPNPTTLKEDWEKLPIPLALLRLWEKF